MRSPPGRRVCRGSARSAGGLGGRPGGHFFGGLEDAEVGRVHLEAGVGPVTNESVELEVVICRVRQDDVWQGGLHRDTDGGGALGGRLAVAGLVTEPVNLQTNSSQSVILFPGHLTLSLNSR